MPDVRLPDGTVIKNVPDGMTKNQLLDRLEASGRDVSGLRQSAPIATPDPITKAEQRNPSFLQRFPHTAGVVGAAENALTAGAGIVDFFNPIRGLAGIGAAVVPGGKTGPEMIESLSIAPRLAPRTERGQQIAEGVSRVGQAVSNFTSDAIERGVEDVSRTPRSPVDVPPFLLSKLLGKPGLAAATETALAAPGIVAPKAIPRAAPGQIIPEVGELFKASGVAFNRARQLGGGIKDTALSRVTTRIADLKNDVGLRLDFDPELHPQSSRVRTRLLETLSKPDVDFDQLMTLRELASDVAGSKNKAERFRGVMLRNEIDDFVDSLKPSDVLSGNPQAAAESLNTARQLWRDASAARTIERQINLAGIDAGDVTGAGFENKLRIRFRQLARSIEQGRERGFTKAEIAAINRVAKGGPIGNIFRFFGQSAPTGIVSSGVGSIAGGMALGPAGAIGVPLLGLLGRRLATKATIDNAQKAQALPLTNSIITP